MNTSARPPSSGGSSWIQRALIVVLKGYRLLLSPWLGSQCRFEPTCSRYAIEAIETHGAGRGSYLAARRVLRCHPWCAGGLDPVPPLAGRDARGDAHRFPASGSP